jgi:hypothetical protein
MTVGGVHLPLTRFSTGSGLTAALDGADRHIALGFALASEKAPLSAADKANTVTTNAQACQGPPSPGQLRCRSLHNLDAMPQQRLTTTRKSVSAALSPRPYCRECSFSEAQVGPRFRECEREREVAA